MADEPTKNNQARKAVTLQDIADRCGLTKTTISHALRENRKQVSAQTIGLVRAVAEEMGYDPACHFSARHLALQRFGQRPASQTVALFLPRGAGTTYIEDPYYSRIYVAAVSELFIAGYGALALEFNAINKGQLASTPVFFSGYVDGVMALGIPTELSEFFRYVQETAHIDFPILTLIDEYSPYPAVVADDRQGAYLAAKHLLDLGHRHLLHFQSDEFVISRNRLAGYQAAYADQDLPAERYLHFCPSWYEYDFMRNNPHFTVQAAIEEAQACWPHITGILAGNDKWAEQIAQSMVAMGLTIPDEMSLVGFDDTRAILDAQGKNMLTTIAVPLETIGRRAAQRVIELIQHPEQEATGVDERIVLPTRLIVRGSTAGPPSRTT